MSLHLSGPASLAGRVALITGGSGAQLAQRYYAATVAGGWSGRYFPAVIEVVDQNIGLPQQPGTIVKG